jgi:methylene-tetrahydromethanopterin dehydrogenase
LLDEKFEAIRDADIILATAGPGIQILPKEVLEKADEKLRIVADVNAVPPSGVEGLEPKDDFKKIMPNIYGIGALVIGDLKYKVEGALLEDMRKGGANIYDYEEAFKKARGLLAYKEEAITEIV